LKLPLGAPGNPPTPPPELLAAHVPEDVGWLMVTERAVIVPFDDEPEIVTQSPAMTEEAAMAVVWLKVVDVVQFTVTWPDV
jgi:hypothetical protein